MKKVSPDFQYEVTEENMEINVEVNYRCHFAPGMAFYPMIVSGSIHKGHTLQDFIALHKRDYEIRDGYARVDVINVLIDIE